MEWYYILLIVIGSIILLNTLLIFLISYICFRMTFYVSHKKKIDEDELPFGDDYDAYKDKILNNLKMAKELPHKDYYITSYDGLKLHAMYFESFKGGPIEIMFHGYRGNAFRDMSAGITRAKSVGRNALLIEQRTSGESEGNVITFGIKERHDCISWINFVIEEFGEDIEIALAGVSMGGSTVLLASGMDLPKNVKMILADSSFHNAKDIIKKCVKDLKLPADIFYPFIKLGAKLYGKFDLEETSSIEAVKQAKVPIIFFHGLCDDFVPCEMSYKLFESCASRKKFITIPNAHHGLCYLVEPEKYVNELKIFIEE